MSQLQNRATGISNESSIAARAPRKILLIGAGRLSKHLEHYFSKILGHQTQVIAFRNFQQDAIGIDFQCFEICFLLTRDDCLAQAAELVRNTTLNKCPLFHCSGLVQISGVDSWHPLASFSYELFADSFYASIPFVGTPNAPALSTLLPNFSNPELRLDSQKRSLYHALCVLAGNVSSALWAHAQTRFSDDLDLPKSALNSFAESIHHNVSKLGIKGLSGPLIRSDHSTLAQNLEALQGDPYRPVLVAAIAALSQTLDVLNRKESHHV